MPDIRPQRLMEHPVSQISLLTSPTSQPLSARLAATSASAGSLLNVSARGAGPASVSSLNEAQNSVQIDDPTIRALLDAVAARSDLLQALTPDALAGAASPSATAATLDSFPFPSGQNPSYASAAAIGAGGSPQIILPAEQTAALGEIATVTGLSIGAKGDSGGEYTVTISATNGTLGAPSSPSRGSLVQLIGTLSQINNSLQTLNFEGTSPGSATISVTSVTIGGLPVPREEGNPATTIKVTAVSTEPLQAR